MSALAMPWPRLMPAQPCADSGLARRMVAWLSGMLGPISAQAERYARSAMAGQGSAEARRHADRRLVARVLAGESRAEAELLDRLLPHLRAVARTILPNPADVDDAVQVALMRVLEGLSSYRGDSSLVRWSRRVAAHACLRQREQNRRRLRLIRPEPEANEDQIAGPTPEDGLGEALPRHVAEYLAKLPPAQREALVLRHVLDYSVAEVAELVGAPVDTVKSRLLYARRALRGIIRRDTARAGVSMPVMGSASEGGSDRARAEVSR